jgi:type III pantothenate kinase
MFLSIDAGNSNIVFGFYDERENLWKHELRINAKNSLHPAQLERELHLHFLENGIKAQDISGIGFSSVTPEINPSIERVCDVFFGKACYVIHGKSYLRLKVHTDKPDEIGSDLMCNAAAAYQRFNEACIIVDFGTALTFTVISPDGHVLGVNIVPGLKTAVNSLYSNTAKLPEVELKMPISAIGKDTIHSIQAGILFGYTGLVKGMIQTIQQELGYTCKVIATGGLSSILTHLQEDFQQIDRNLTLEGIKIITEANQL